VLVPIEDPADPRLADYADLTDVAARQQREGQEFFIAEGPVAIERLLQSDHPLRSVLVSTRKYERLAPPAIGIEESNNANYCVCVHKPGYYSNDNWLAWDCQRRWW